ncbi:MAG: hypothetical protein DSM106950_07330 [Stigonema ocellatum SAG 48.90 = DSM 106950]|nr:hypothetical protein [Stigonema ocellatum SAG 48.90 = DSM 106950]
MENATNPDTNFKWQYTNKQEGYTIYQSGSHIRGDFIQVFVPDSPYHDEKGKRKLITYLHGFGLCLPKFYEAHLEVLAKKGYYVFFPDFQNSDYPNELDQNKLIPSQNKRHLYFWYQMVIDTITQRKTPSTEKFVQQKRKAEEFHRIREDQNEPSPLNCLIIALALVVIILIVRLIYLFSPEYSKNLVKLISTVGLSLLYSPSVWMERAISLTSHSWHKLWQDHPEFEGVDFDFYIFGHSLGGLLALSWPAYITETKFFPKQIITADPAPSTEMGIPQIAVFILKLFRSPFTLEPITIRKTGVKLDIPVGILHGADDNIVKPQSWIGRSLWNQKTNFDSIVSSQKKIYFSLSKKQDNPPLIAFHNQAVTDTTYFNDALFNNFGGVKDEPNAYNYQYIWPGLQLVVENQVEANDLLNQFPLKTIIVTDTLPPLSSRFTLVILLVGLALLGLAYWFWHSGAVLA